MEAGLSRKPLPWTREGSSWHASLGPYLARLTVTDGDQRDAVVVRISFVPVAGEAGEGSEDTPTYIRARRDELGERLEALKRQVEAELHLRAGAVRAARPRESARPREVADPGGAVPSPGLYRMRKPPEGRHDVLAEAFGRRRHARFRVGVRAAVVARSRAREKMGAEIVDLSVGGCFITANAPLRIGMPVKVSFMAESLGRCSASGRIVRLADRGGAGVQFDEVTTSLRDFLVGLADAPLAAREEIAGSLRDAEVMIE
jgi:hypothetical protein